MSQESKEGTPFEKRTREVLEESTARLDGRTLSRLTQARHAALEKAHRPARQGWRLLVPAGAAAAAAVVVLTSLGPEQPEQPGQPAVAAQNPLEDLEILEDADAPDFEDSEELEFYEWAADEMES
jgi:anti-sigma-K factor RskA